MSRVAYVDGQYVPHRLGSGTYRGSWIQFADGVYEVLAVVGGHLVASRPVGEIAFGGDGVTGMQLAGVNALADGALNPLVGGQTVAILRWHSVSRTVPERLPGRLG